MDLTIWFIILMITNLSAPHSKKFSLLIKKDNVVEGYICKEYYEGFYVVEWPYNAENKSFAPSSKIIPVNYVIKNNNELNTLMVDQKISIEKLVVNNTEWKTCSEIKMSELGLKEGFSSILVKRLPNGFTLSQKSGFLSEYSEIKVEFLK